MKLDACPVEPPGLGSGPLSSRTMSRQPRRQRWKATLLPTMPHPITTARARTGNPLKASFRRVGRAHLFRQLVPPDPIPDLGAKPPFQWLRLRLDGAPELVETRPDQRAIDVQLIEGLA